MKNLIPLLVILLVVSIAFGQAPPAKEAPKSPAPAAKAEAPKPVPKPMPTEAGAWVAVPVRSCVLRGCATTWRTVWVAKSVATTTTTKTETISTTAACASCAGARFGFGGTVIGFFQNLWLKLPHPFGLLGRRARGCSSCQ